jgi:hypothetical protein
MDETEKTIHYDRRISALSDYDIAKEGNVSLLDADNAESVTAAMTPQTDDPNTPALTFRAVFLGTIWAIFLATCNVLFSFRTNAFYIPTGLAQLMSYPMGIFLAWILPKGGWLNPGPFSIKEHVLIYIIAGAAGGTPYGLDNVIGQYSKHLMGDSSITVWSGLAWVFGTQMIGYGVAGICRRFLVYPSAMLWPQVLPNIALFTSLNSVETLADVSARYRVSRFAFFWAAFFSMFVWSFIPQLFAPTLSTVSLLCLITSNRTARFLGSAGPNEGMGLLSITFDWSLLSSYQPLTYPFWAQLNTFSANAFWQWLVVPICYYANVWATPIITSTYFWGGKTDDPIGALNTNKVFNSTGSRVWVRRPNLQSPKAEDDNYILDQNFKLDIDKYNRHGPFYLSEYFVISYFTSFMNIACVITHVYLWYGQDLKRQVKSALAQMSLSEGQTDVHSKLMKAYPEVPEWIYLAWLAVMIVANVLICQFTQFYMPWWATLFAVFIGIFFTIPVGIIQAISGTQIGLNVITEFIIGLIIPGETIAVICFKSFGYNVMIQALFLVADLKLGHYMHIAPYSMVGCQIWGTLIGVLFNTFPAFYIMDNLKFVFEHDSWLAVGHHTFLTAMGIWGAIGPARFFGAGSPYFGTMLAFPIGIVLPVIPWLLNKWKPHPNWYLINMPLLTFIGSPGGYQSAFIMAVLTGFAFQYWARRNRKEWFDKYNYTLAIALDSGMSIATLTIVLLQLATETEDGGDRITPSGTILAPSTSTDFYCFDLPYAKAAK